MLIITITMLIQKLLIPLIFITLYLFSNVKTRKLFWLESLTNYLKKEAYQVLLLTDKYFVNEEVENVINEISKNVPTFKIDFQDANDKQAKILKSLPSFNDPQATVDILIFSSKKEKFEILTNFIVNISEYKSRPKCFMIFTEENEKSFYKMLLEKMWLQKFLDVIVLEFLDERIYKVV